MKYCGSILFSWGVCTRFFLPHKQLHSYSFVCCYRGSSTFTCSFLYLQCYLFVISYLLFLIQLGLDINPDEMAALGIGGIGIGNDDDDDEEDEDDESLEAELAALQGQSSSRGKKKSNCLVLCY